MPTFASGNPTYEAPRENLTSDQAREQAMAEQARADATAQAAQTTQATADAISGPGTGVLNISGSSEARQGGLEGLQFGQMLYGQGIGDVGKEAGDYSSRVKGLLSKDYAGADVQRQLANQNLAKNSAKMGLGATNNFGAQEQLRRQGSMQSAMMNQDYQDKALALYGKNVSAKQSGLASTYFGAKGTGQANTPTPVQSSGGCVIATHAVSCGAFDKSELSDAVKWCKKALHDKWWGESVRRGYRFLGKRAIANGVAENHYEEFKRFIKFGNGKKRTFRGMITFTYRCVQMFVIGLFVRE